MKNEPHESEDLLHDLLHGDAEDGSLRALASKAAENPELAKQIAEELQFSELIRQILLEDSDRSESLFHEAREASKLEIGDLTRSVCEGDATSAICDRLARHLWDHPEDVLPLKQQLASDEWIRESVSEAKSEDAFVEALETRMWAETKNDHFVDDLADRLVREDAESESANIISFPNRWREAGLQVAAAAAIALGAFFVAYQLSDSERTDSSVATITKASGEVRWEGGQAPDEAGGMAPGQYHLESGVVALEFESGSEMTIEGPAVFEVGDDDSARVLHGVALARTHSPENGIRLGSRGLSLSDPIPLIGIDARSEFSTKAIVFEGDGGVCLNEGDCRPVYENEAIKADLTREKLVGISFNPQPFANAWELLSGVERNLGPVRIELPGTEIQPDEHEAEVQVFVENESFQPAEDLEVDQINVGQFASADLNEGQKLQANGELRSYLLQLWPSEINGEEDVEASLTFDHEIVGIIYSSDRLANSDQSVGTSVPHVGEEFNDGRGLDLGSDEFLLSEDRRTLNLKLNSGNLEVDQVRVLVALN